MLHNKSFLPLSREKSNGTNERSIVQDRRNNLSDRISFPNYQLSSRNVFWTILTNENRPNHTGRSNLNVSSPQDSLDISSPDFQNQGLPPFNPRSSSRARATRRESRGKLSLSLFLSPFRITRRSVEDSWHGRTSRQWHRVVLHHFWDRYLEAGQRERRHRAAKERTFREDAAVTTQFSLFFLSEQKKTRFPLLSPRTKKSFQKEQSSPSSSVVTLRPLRTKDYGSQ